MFFKLFVVLFVIMNLIVNLLVFLLFIVDCGLGFECKMVFILFISLLVGVVIVVVSGNVLLNVFGISLDVFCLVGGFLVFLIVFSFIFGE